MTYPAFGEVSDCKFIPLRNSANSHEQAFIRFFTSPAGRSVRQSADPAWSLEHRDRRRSRIVVDLRQRKRFFVNAGPCLSLLLRESLRYLPDSGSKEKVADETGAYHRFNLAVTAGAGIAVPVGKRFLVSLEVRDNFGVLNIRSAASDFEYNSTMAVEQPTGHTNSTLLLAGISYKLGGSKGLPCTPNNPGFQYLRK